MTTPAGGRVQAPGPVRLPRLGPGHLRRGAPAAGAGLPDDRRPAVPPPARADRDAGPRGRPGGRRVLADRPEAVRRAVEGHRVAGLDRPGRVHRGAGDADRRRAAGLRHRRARGAVQDRLHRPHQAAGGARRCWTGTPASRPWSSAPTWTSWRSSARSSTRRSSRAPPRNAERERLLRRVPGRRGLARWSCPRWRTSPSTCPRRRWRSRCPARSARGRRRRSGSAGCCGRRPTGGRRTSTRSSPRDTLDTEYAAHRQRFLAEQGYAYTIVDADDLLAAG